MPWKYTTNLILKKRQIIRNWIRYWKKFDAHCLSKKNETNERYVSRTRKQHEGEAFDRFLTYLKIKAKTYNFNELRDSMIRDQIVFGICDKKVRERLLR